MIRIAVFLLLFVVLLGCSSRGNPEYLPQATGRPGDMIIVIDSTQWKGPLGTALKKVFNAEVQGLPREETLFDVIHVHPSQKIELLAQVRNLIYVFTLDEQKPGSITIMRGLTPESIDRIRSDTSYYVSTAEDLNAKGQKVMYLFGQNEKALIHHIREHARDMVEFFNKAERERLGKSLFKTNATKNITEFLKKEHQFSMRLPYGYKLADQQKDFIWFRQIEMEVDKDIFVTWKPYESQYQMLPDSLIEWRDETARKYLFGDPENPISYLMTETEVPFNPVRAKQVEINGHYTMEIKGLWRTNNKSMGGPFVGYSLVDEQNGLLYYFEGFTYSPSKSQREIIRELETILWTFQTSHDLGIPKSD
jgi:Domain of unknown function (DUF4837)